MASISSWVKVGFYQLHKNICTQCTLLFDYAGRGVHLRISHRMVQQGNFCEAIKCRFNCLLLNLWEVPLVTNALRFPWCYSAWCSPLLLQLLGLTFQCRTSSKRHHFIGIFSVTYFVQYAKVSKIIFGCGSKRLRGNTKMFTHFWS
jgi:hypothetical protein